MNLLVEFSNPSVLVMGEDSVFTLAVDILDVTVDVLEYSVDILPVILSVNITAGLEYNVLPEVFRTVTFCRS